MSMKFKYNRKSRGKPLQTDNNIGVHFFLFVLIVSLVFSQVCGYLINSTLGQGRSMEVTSFVYFTHVRNLGGIFGILQGKGWVFAVISLLLLSFITFYVYMADDIRRYEYFCYGLIVGGGLSNILDRLIYGSVIDFIELRGIPYWHYIFNTADVTIHLGVWPLVIVNLLYGDKKTTPLTEEDEPVC